VADPPSTTRSSAGAPGSQPTGVATIAPTTAPWWVGGPAATTATSLTTRTAAPTMTGRATTAAPLVQTIQTIQPTRVRTVPSTGDDEKSSPSESDKDDD